MRLNLLQVKTPFVIVIAFAALLYVPNSLSGDEDWPRWRGPRGDGSWNAPPIADQLPPGGLKTVWNSPIAAGYSGIAVANGRLYTMDKPTQPADTERIVCLDAKTGKLTWEQSYQAKYADLDYGKGPRCTPTVFDGRIYTLGAVGHVHCLDEASGKVLWKHDLVSNFKAQQPTWGFAASPVIHRDMVIIHAGMDRGAYLALDRFTGKELWRGGPDPTGYGTPIIIHRGGREELVGWTPEHILGLLLVDGRELWRIPYKVTYGVSIAAPVFVNNTVIVCGYWDGSKAIRLGTSATDAKLVWEENKFLRGIMSQPLCRGGYGYLLDKQHGVVCFELATGEKKWADEHQITPRDRNPQVNMVWLGDTQRALCLNAEGELELVTLEPSGPKEHWRAKLVGPTWAHPAFAGRHVYARDDSEIVCAELPGM
jgi:outer membrane protein assembly factor BamB